MVAKRKSARIEATAKTGRTRTTAGVKKPRAKTRTAPGTGKAKAKRVAKKNASRPHTARKVLGSRATAKPTAEGPPAKTQSPKRPASRVRHANLAGGAPGQLGFPVVGVGASAGGLQAFEELFRHLPANPGMAFVLVSHLDPDHASILHELLGKSSALPVRQVTDGVRLAVDQVYVGPPGKDVAILNGTLQLMDPTERHGERLPIDYWFRSLAQDQRENAVGIILSGNGSDGALGVKAIKGESGMVMAQEPDSAKFTGMPCSAIATGMVDFVLPAGQIGEHLLRWAQGPYLRESEQELSATDRVSAIMQKIFVLLRGRTGHDFSSYKTSTLRRRIARRMNIHQIEGHKQYIRYLEENPQEIDLLFKELLIGVTNFFRDADAFDALGKKALPAMVSSKREGTPLRVWVAGCSTGEEAYSLAILLRETLDRLKQHREIQIFATDLDARAIETARGGSYPDGISVDVSRERLRRFFTKEDGSYRIKKDIRETVIFAEQNVIKDPPFTRLDLISCRNLLIYLRAESQKRLLPLFHHALNPGGVLFLGTSEAIGGFSELFQVVDKKWKVFARKPGSVPVLAAQEFPPPPVSDEAADFASFLSARAERQPSIAELTYKMLAERYAPPSVIVNERGDIVYIHGHTGVYLQPAPGQPTHNVLAMAREGLRYELTAALREVARHDGKTVHKALQVKTNGGSARVDLGVDKITKPEALRGLLAVTFQAASEIVPSIRSERPAGRISKRKGTGRETALEKELQYTKESLQSTIEALETSNEELKSTNEELQSTNEEMQSTNEELETSKEEMHSLNEELQTVNSELQGKIDELSRVNDDMTNLLNATDIATIFLDNDLRVKRFTVQASDVIRLIPSDVGRPLADIVSRLRYRGLEQDALRVLQTLTYRELEVESETGTWYQMRIMPYRTSENLIDGLVITFVNIAAIKVAQAQAQADNATVFEDMVNAVREPLLTLDESLRVVTVNRAFLRAFGMAKESTVGRLVWELGNGQWDIPELRRLLMGILPGDTTVEDIEVSHNFAGIGRRVMLLNARHLEQDAGKPRRILLTIEDVTERPESQK